MDHRPEMHVSPVKPASSKKRKSRSPRVRRQRVQSESRNLMRFPKEVRESEIDTWTKALEAMKKTKRVYHCNVPTSKVKIVCGLCLRESELLPGRICRNTIQKLRKRWREEVQDKDRDYPLRRWRDMAIGKELVMSQKYSAVKLCLYCSQFFPLSGEEEGGLEEESLHQSSLRSTTTVIRLGVQPWKWAATMAVIENSRDTRSSVAPFAKTGVESRTKWEDAFKKLSKEKMKTALELSAKMGQAKFETAPEAAVAIQAAWRGFATRRETIRKARKKKKKV